LELEQQIMETQASIEKGGEDGEPNNNVEDNKPTDVSTDDD
jgi:hypothetical protein